MTHEGVNKAIQDREKLKNLKVGSELTFKVADISNHGLTGDFMGYRVFLPFSQCTAQDYMNRESFKDREITAIVIELNNIKKSIVCSTKLLENNQTTPVEVGDSVEGSVIKIEEKYAIVLLRNGAKAKLSISDASHTRINNISEVVELDNEYLFKVLETNLDYSRISVGLKQLQESPLDKIYASINIGDEVCVKW